VQLAALGRVFERYKKEARCAGQTGLGFAPQKAGLAMKPTTAKPAKHVGCLNFRFFQVFSIFQQPNRLGHGVQPIAQLASLA